MASICLGLNVLISFNLSSRRHRDNMAYWGSNWSGDYNGYASREEEEVYGRGNWSTVNSLI